MQFTVNVKELMAAMDVVRVVKPNAIAGTKVTGFRFVVHDGVCFIYSRDTSHILRAQLKAIDSDGDVDLIFPDLFDAWTNIHAETLTFEDKSSGGNFVVALSSADRGGDDERATANPKLMAMFDEDYASATSSAALSSGILRTALATLKGYIASDKDRVDDMYKTIQIFDGSKPEWEKGNGVMFAANSICAGYFECAALLDRHLPIFRDHLPVVLSFISKSDGDVNVRLGENMTFFEDSNGSVLGIQRNVKIHPRFSYFPLEKDSYIFKVDSAVMLASLRFCRLNLNDAGRDKIRLTYDHANGVFKLGLSESSSKSNTPVIPIQAREFRVAEPFAFNVNVNHMLDLFNVASNVIEFRVALVTSGTKNGAIFRTLDRFFCDKTGKVVADITQEGAVECKVTRLMPSKD